MTRRLGPVIVIAGLTGLPGCQPSASANQPSPAHQLGLASLVGGWQWMLRTSEAGTTRIEDEQWRIGPGPTPTQLRGRYIRSVEVRSDDRVAFRCNHRPWYRQRAVFELAVEAAPNGFSIREIDYHTEPSPCDHGFRHLGSYTAQLAGERVVLRWDGGIQTLWRVDDKVSELPPDPWSAAPTLAGEWRWDTTSYDDDGNLRDESEWWQITRRTDTRIDATYVRRVTVRSPDGASIPCAAAATWSYEDAYVLDGQREEEHWHLFERASDRGEHPCLRTTPQRALDEATAEQLGDYLILEWRGKRKQLLYRREARADERSREGAGGA